MKEFILLIRNDSDHQATWSPEQHQQFMEICEDYISNLTKEGKLKSAKPLVRESKMISVSKGPWMEGPFNEAKQVIVGYYHIAKGNPKFESGTNARIEVYPIQ
jgi:hypothetical protein